MKPRDPSDPRGPVRTNTRQPRHDRDADRGAPRRADAPRPPRAGATDRTARPPRRDDRDASSRPPRRDYGDRPGAAAPRRDDRNASSRPPRRDHGDRPGAAAPRRDDRDAASRPPRRDDADRGRAPPRRDYGPAKPQPTPRGTDGSAPRTHATHDAPRGADASVDEVAAPRPHLDRDAEQRVFGVNACQAVFARRPEAIRKIYLVQARVDAMRTVLAWAARERIGYRIVESDDLRRLTGSEHHEGVCFEILRAAPLTLDAWLDTQGDRARPSLALLLDGVGNPHNFGAVLRIAAHFGVGAVLLPPGSSLALSGATTRVAEGGAEIVPLVALADVDGSLRALEAAGFTLAATVVRDGDDLYATPLPRRLVLIFGAEGGGVSPTLLERLERRLRIPGTGAVESLNIAAAVGVATAEFWRQHHRG